MIENIICIVIFIAFVKAIYHGLNDEYTFEQTCTIFIIDSIRFILVAIVLSACIHVLQCGH